MLRQLLSGQPVKHEGAHYTVEDVTVQPVPTSPIPFWIGGNSQPALRRAARWNGWLPDTADMEGMTVTPSQIEEGLRTIHGLRPDDTPFEVAVFGYSEPGDASVAAAYAAAGATWWLEYSTTGAAQSKRCASGSKPGLSDARLGRGVRPARARGL